MTPIPGPNRRAFVKTAGLAALAAALPGSPARAATAAAAKARAFKLDLNPGIIGVSAQQRPLLQLAIRHGFESITPFPQELAGLSKGDLDSFLDEKRKHGIAWGSTNLPVEFRQDEERFRNDLAQLPRLCSAMQRVGAQLMNTWIMPTHPSLHYGANMRQHAARLGDCARALADNGIKLGLEYVGPKTLMARDRFAFIRTMVELQDLLEAIGEPNVGYVLDSFHWHCAEDTVDQIRALSPESIVSVDLNDARADLSRDQQIDGTRELPLATGVIELKPFLQALVDIGYAGPIRAEPFNQALNDLDDNAAVAATAKAMRAAFALVD